jgi:AcrR family transcriptional regulator
VATQGTTRRKPVRKTRAEKLIDTRRALIEAALAIVGKHGYQAASIAKITEKAKVAQGTFYNYFRSRQEIIELLPPYYGEIMLDYIKSNINPVCSGVDREVDRLRTFCDFIKQNPWYSRVINEALTLAPRGYQKYFTMVTNGYLSALQRSIARGEITRFKEDELEPVVYMLLATRTYFAQQYLGIGSKVHEVPQSVLDTYRKFIEPTLFAPSESEPVQLEMPGKVAANRVDGFPEKAKRERA